MYDELVKRLRELQFITEHCGDQPCSECEAKALCDKNDNEALIKTYEAAAAAIEELSRKYIEERNAAVELTGELASKHRWIPVTERLPEEYKDVLCYYEYFRYGDYNCMFRTIDRGYYGNGRWGGEAGQGHKNKVLAWMPLPSTEGLNEA